jgi:mannose-6-phosphate isomerase
VEIICDFKTGESFFSLDQRVIARDCLTRSEVLPLMGEVRNYAWGSATAIPELLGQEPDGTAVAEIWFGAHTTASATVLSPEGAVFRLDHALAAEPHALGGLAELPFLMKILGVDRSLSLQVHPTRAQAQVGYARDEREGLRLGSPLRRYSDPNHKPELIVALTPFRALAGMRPPTDAARVATGFDCPALEKAFRPFATDPTPSGAHTTLSGLLRLRASMVHDVLGALLEAAPRALTHRDPLVRRAADLVILLADQHPGDIGIAAALLLNDVTLSPGEGLFQPAGMLHAYVNGLGIEVMASSDNVLRAGLTSKPIAVEEVLAILDPSCGPASILPAPIGQVGEWPVPVEDFRLRRVFSGVEGMRMAVSCPAIALAVAGEVTIAKASRRLTIGRGNAAFIVGAGDELTISGKGEFMLADCPSTFRRG